jgi:hypothetical protein
MLQTLYRDAVWPIVWPMIEDWTERTAWQSSITSMTRDPLFAQITEWGTPVAEIILSRMDAGDIRLHWFPVLQDTLKADPVPPYSRGNVREMADAWLTWGRAHNVI